MGGPSPYKRGCPVPPPLEGLTLLSPPYENCLHASREIYHLFVHYWHELSAVQLVVVRVFDWQQR